MQQLELSPDLNIYYIRDSYQIQVTEVNNGQTQGQWDLYCSKGYDIIYPRGEGSESTKQKPVK